MYDGGRITAKLGQITRAKRRGCGDDVAPKAWRLRVLKRQQMRAYNVFNLDAAMQKLIGLGVLGRIARADLGIVVGFGEEPGCP